MRDGRNKQTKRATTRRRAVLFAMLLAASPAAAQTPQSGARLLPPLPLQAAAGTIKSNPFCAPPVAPSQARVATHSQARVELASGNELTRTAPPPSQTGLAPAAMRLKPLGTAVGLHPVLNTSQSHARLRVEAASQPRVQQNDLIGSLHHTNVDLVDTVVESSVHAAAGVGSGDSSIVLIPPVATTEHASEPAGRPTWVPQPILTSPVHSERPPQAILLSAPRPKLHPAPAQTAASDSQPESRVAGATVEADSEEAGFSFSLSDDSWDETSPVANLSDDRDGSENAPTTQSDQLTGSDQAVVAESVSPMTEIPPSQDPAVPALASETTGHAPASETTGSGAPAPVEASTTTSQAAPAPVPELITEDEQSQSNQLAERGTKAPLKWQPPVKILAVEPSLNLAEMSLSETEPTIESETNSIAVHAPVEAPEFDSPQDLATERDTVIAIPEPVTAEPSVAIAEPVNLAEPVGLAEPVHLNSDPAGAHVASPASPDSPAPKLIYRDEPVVSGPIPTVDALSTTDRAPTAEPTLHDQRYRPPVAVTQPPLAVTRPAERSTADNGDAMLKSVSAPELAVSAKSIVPQGHRLTPLYMNRTQVKSLTIGGSVRRVQVGDKTVCQAITSGANHLKLIGTGTGVTQLVVWADSDDVNRPRMRAFEIHVTDGLAAKGNQADAKTAHTLSQTIGSMFPGCDVRVHERSGRLLVSGRCDSEASAKSIVRMVRKACVIPVIDELRVR